MKRAEAIRFLCRALAPAPHDGSLRRWIESGAVDWERMAQVSSAHLLTPALGPALARKGLLGAVPEDFREYLGAIDDLNGERNRAILAQLAEAAAALNRAGIEPMPLKGLAAMLDGVWDDPAERLLRDIDLLLPEGTLGAALEALAAIGYAERRDLPAGPHHHWPLAREGDEATLELHFELGDEAFGLRRILPTETIWARSRAAELGGGGRARVPCAEDQLVHGILHAQLHHRGDALGRLDLRHMHELALIGEREPGGIDWAEVARRFESAGAGEMLAADLLAAEELFGFAFPSTLAASPPARRRAQRMIAAAGSTALGTALYYRGKARLAAANPGRLGVFLLHLACPSWYLRRLREIASLMRGEPK